MATVRKVRTAPKASAEDAPQRILAAATALFAQRGYDGTTTKEICEAAGVNIAAMHYHFDSKEALFRLIIERFGDSRLESVQRILSTPETADEMRVRLELFLGESLAVFFQRPELCRIVQTEIELLHSRSEAAFRKTFVKLFDTLCEFLKGAQKRGLIARSIDTHLAAMMLFSQLRQVTRGEAVNRKYFRLSLREDEVRERWVQHTVGVFLDGARSAPPGDATSADRKGGRQEGRARRSAAGRTGIVRSESGGRSVPTGTGGRPLKGTPQKRPTGKQIGEEGRGRDAPRAPDAKAGARRRRTKTDK